MYYPYSENKGADQLHGYKENPFFFTTWLTWRRCFMSQSYFVLPTFLLPRLNANFSGLDISIREDS